MVATSGSATSSDAGPLESRQQSSHFQISRADSGLPSIQLWQFIVASAAGAGALLPLLFFLSWKVGFFKTHKKKWRAREKSSRRKTTMSP